jgi:hypothetical protein
MEQAKDREERGEGDRCDDVAERDGEDPVHRGCSTVVVLRRLHRGQVTRFGASLIGALIAHRMPQAQEAEQTTTVGTRLGLSSGHW